MAKPESQPLLPIYEDYLGTLDAVEVPMARRALESWNRFLEGRTPGEVDGKRREWFEMAQEESGLEAAQVRQVSERIERFYEWLSLARPEELRAAAPKAPRPSPGGHAAPPPPELAGEKNLWKPGPSVGPPPSAQRSTPPHAHAPLKPEAALRNRRLPLIAMLSLFGVPALLLLPYLIIWAPVGQLEQDIGTYLANAGEREMGGFYTWLFPAAQERGFEIVPGGIKIERAEQKTLLDDAAAFRDRKRKLENKLRIPAVQRFLGQRRDVVLEVEAVTDYPVPDPPLPDATVDAVPPRPIREVPQPRLRLTKAQYRTSREMIEALSRTIDNYRRIVPSAPAKANAFLAEEIAPVKKRALSELPETPSREELLEALEKLEAIAAEPVALSALENSLFPLETLLRQAERHAAAEAGEGEGP